VCDQECETQSHVQPVVKLKKLKLKLKLKLPR